MGNGRTVAQQGLLGALRRLGRLHFPDHIMQKHSAPIEDHPHDLRIPIMPAHFGHFPQVAHIGRSLDLKGFGRAGNMLMDLMIRPSTLDAAIVYMEPAHIRIGHFVCAHHQLHRIPFYYKSQLHTGDISANFTGISGLHRLVYILRHPQPGNTAVLLAGQLSSIENFNILI